MSPRRIFVIAILIGLVGAGAYYYRSRSPEAQQISERGGGRGGAAGAAVPVIAVPVEVENFAIRRRTIGIIETPATVVVKSRVDSQVMQQHVVDGQLVNKGDLLFTLDDRDIKAVIARDEAQLSKDKAALARTEADLGRFERLSESNAAPRQQLDQAIADNKAAAATVELDQAQLRSDQLRLAYTKIEAPIEGRIGAVRVTPGNLVSANDENGLVTITQMKPIRVAFTLAERDLGALREAAARETPTVVRVYTPGATQPLATGELEFVDSTVDTTSGTIAAKARFANDKMELWPGMFVDVEIDLDVRPNTIMIPTVAIQASQQGGFVFVVKPDNTVEARTLQLVGVEGDRAAVASGLNPGERVIVEGQMRLTNGARVSEVAADSQGGRRNAPASGAAGGRP